jgi:hypothetical protein
MTQIDFDSPAGLVAAFLHRNAKEVLDRSAAAARLSCAPAAVDKLLEPAVQAGLITVANDGDLGRVWRAGRGLAAWATANGATLPQATTKAKPAARKATHPALPELSLAGIKVAADVPVPQKQRAKGKTKYDAIFNALKKDGMSATGIASIYSAALSSSANQYLKGRPELAAKSRFVVRSTGNDTCGVWRVAKAEA